MPRQHKPKSRIHLRYAIVEVSRFPNGILSGVPMKRREMRLVNTGADYSGAKHNTTSRCLRVKREAAAFTALPARERGKSILSKVGSALAGLAGR